MGNWLQQQWGAAVMMMGWGKTLFVFLRFFLKFVFSSSFIGCVRDCKGWLDSQQVSYKITAAGSCDCVLLSILLSNRAFNVFHTGLGTFVVAGARHCFPSKLAGKGIFLHHRCRERVWARILGSSSGRHQP